MCLFSTLNVLLLLFCVFTFMNTLWRRLQKIHAILFNDQCKLSLQLTNSPTKHRTLYQLIHEAPVPSKKMWAHNGVNRACYSTDASSNYRAWKNISSDRSSAQESGVPFKIVSYNILAQDLLLDHLQLYTRSSKKYIKWKYRLDRLTQKIVEQRPDIICLQEVQENHLADIMSGINSNLPSMSCIYKKKTGVKTDGCAIIYNANLFELILWDVVEFYRPGIQVLDRHNIALIAKFHCKSQKKAKFLVSTTHLLFNPKRQDVRLAQIMVLLAELDRHSIVKPGKLQRMPVLLTGDFNFDSNSAPFELITTGKLYYESLAKKSLTESGRCGSPPIGKTFISDQLGITDNCQHIECVKSNYKNMPQTIQINDSHQNDSKLFSTGTLTHGLNLQSAYNHSDGRECGSIFQGKWVTIDHLFYTPENPKEPKNKTVLKLISIYELPSVKQCQQMGYLPNIDNGSDHLMLAARFYLRFPIYNQ